MLREIIASAIIFASGIMAFAEGLAITPADSAAIAAIESPAPSGILSEDQLDKLLRDNKVVFIDGVPEPAQKQAVIDSLRHEISVFYYDQFRQYNDPGAPYFLFMSRDAAVTMGLGGVVRMRGYYDWGGAIPSPAFAPYMIPIPEDPARVRQFGTTPAGTCLYFRVIGQHRLLSSYQLYIEANFNGYGSRDFHLKKAYATFGDITFGLAPSTFSDGAAQMPMVDANGTVNSITPTSVLVRYMPVIKKHWVLAVSVEDPSTKKQIDLTVPQTEASSNWLPDFAAFVQYQWGKSSHVRLSGIVRCLSYRDLALERNRNVAGWAVQLSAVTHPLPQLTTYLTANYGRGYGSLTADLLIGNYDLVGSPDRPGHLYAPSAFGWNAGIQYHFRPNIFACVGFGQTRYLPDQPVPATEYKYGLMGVANLFWNPTPRTEFGIEFDWGLRSNNTRNPALPDNPVRRSARRIGVLGQFSF